MTLDGRGNVDEIKTAIGEQRLGIAIAAIDAELIADELQPLWVAIADRDNAALNVIPGMHLVYRKEAATDQSSF